MKFLCFEIKYVGFKQNPTEEWQKIALTAKDIRDMTVEIEAIKAYRILKNTRSDGSTISSDDPKFVGLRAAKEVVEEYMFKNLKKAKQ